MFIKISQNVCKDFRKCFQRIYLTAENALRVYHKKKGAPLSSKYNGKNVEKLKTPY
jgi:hypothetical protein